MPVLNPYYLLLDQTKMLFPIVIILTFFQFCSSFTYNPGPCPVIPTPPTFDVEKWASGVWYQLYVDTADAFNPVTKKCAEVRTSYFPDIGTVEFVSYSLTEEKSLPVWSKLYGSVTKTPGVLEYVIQNGSWPFKTAELRILDTDYNEFSVGYLCGYDNAMDRHYLTTGIYSRHIRKHLRNIINDLIKVFKLYGSNINYVPIRWNDCRARCL